MQRRAGVKFVTALVTGVFTAATAVAVSGLGASVTQAANTLVMQIPAKTRRDLSNVLIILVPPRKITSTLVKVADFLKKTLPNLLEPSFSLFIV
ncbi:hypothetical protein [Propionivibrio sp.]|uniref:hypothetical protein n=1 Tax=Propionivibrio sp. TaxID=2212460 RepID=UPI003BEFE978